MTSCTIELNRTRDGRWFCRAWWTEWQGDRPRRRYADTKPSTDWAVVITWAAYLARDCKAAEEARRV